MDDGIVRIDGGYFGELPLTRRQLSFSLYALLSHKGLGVAAEEDVMSLSNNIFQTMNEDSRRFIRKRLPIIKFFIDHERWTREAVRSALDKKDYYQAAFLAQQILISISEGPVRWVLWATLNNSQPIMLGQLLTEVSTKQDMFDADFLDVLYGRSLHDAIKGEIKRIDDLLSARKTYSPEKAARLNATIASIERFGLRELRNALAHQDFYIMEDGALVWQEEDEWAEIPLPYLFGFVDKVLPPVRKYLKELTDYLISFYKLEKPRKQVNNTESV